MAGWPKHTWAYLEGHLVWYPPGREGCYHLQIAEVNHGRCLYKDSCNGRTENLDVV